MDVLVPFSPARPKTRLSGTFSPEERVSFAREMLADTLATVRKAGHEPRVLATESIDCAAPVTVDERALTPAVNDAITEATPVAVVVADLPLATSAAVERLFESSGDIAVAPGRGGGTNALVIRHPEFRVDYHGASFRDHVAIAESIEADVTVVDSHRLATDIDERADLAELLLHGSGTAHDWLVDRGFQVSVTDGRVGIKRSAASRG